MSDLRALAAAWRRDAAQMRAYGATANAATIEACADRLLAKLGELDNELLTATQAAAETPYTEGTIRAMWRDGRLPNEGQPGKPLIRRGNLHRALLAEKRRDPNVAEAVLARVTG